MLRVFCVVLGLCPFFLSAQNQSKSSVSGTYGALVDRTPRNLLSLNAIALMSSNAQISFEHIFSEGYIGLKVPFRFQFIEGYGHQLFTQHKYQMGLDINIYPTGQGWLKYFGGPSFRFGQLASTVIVSNELWLKEPNHCTVFLNNGFIYYSPTSNFTMSTMLGVGSRSFYNESNIGKPWISSEDLILNFECSIGFKL